jgi:UDP-N-acetylglucosamine 2-epimerase (non-hydrolysing)
VRNIGVITVARSDYGILLPVLRRIQADSELELSLIVGGMHLSPEFGMTVKDIEADGFDIAERVEMLAPSDTPEGTAESMGLGTVGFARAYSRVKPDLLLVLGDRFEMHAAAVAALPFNIPLAHIHGGEVTEGAIDDSLRHSITKLSHLHFTATKDARQRVIQMGEEPWRVMVSGAPGLDNLESTVILSRQEISERFSIPWDADPLLVTYHPVTREQEDTKWQVGELLESLQKTGLPIIFTYPNADTKGRLILEMVQRFVDETPQAHIVANLGTQGYFSLMAHTAAMVGNSSSGLIEAPSFGLPVVNIGSRQRGRTRAQNVIDVGYPRDEISAGINEAVSSEFKAGLKGMTNPYGDGHAASVIVDRLKQVTLDRSLTTKAFEDEPTATGQRV